MKKVFMLLAVVIAVSSIGAGCRAAEEPRTPPFSPEASPEHFADIIAAPALSDVQRNVEAMMPILDSITLAMEDGATYLPREPEFFWMVLYLTGVNWGEGHPLVVREGDQVVAPRQVMQEFASAAFLDYDDLLPVPESLSQLVQYDAPLDAYRLTISERGDSSTRVEAVTINADGTVTARVGLYTGRNDLLKSIEFIMVDNPYAGGISDPTFLYSVSSATALD